MTRPGPVAIAPRTEGDVQQLFGLARSVFGGRPEWSDDRVLSTLAPGHERDGIGRRLLAYAEGYAIAEQMHALRVVVERDNDAARSFYRRLGFVPIEAEVFDLVLPQSD